MQPSEVKWTVRLSVLLKLNCAFNFVNQKARLSEVKWSEVK
jgi:hypothetical protein